MGGIEFISGSCESSVMGGRSVVSLDDKVF